MNWNHVIFWLQTFAVDLFFSFIIFLAIFGAAFLLQPSDLFLTIAIWIISFAAYSATRRYKF